MTSEDTPAPDALRLALEASHAAPDSDGRWEHIRAVVANDVNFDAACALCASESAVERRLGCDLLGHILRDEESYRLRGAEALRPCINDDDDEVAASAIAAFGHAAPADITFLEPFATHASSSLRFAVTLAVNNHESPAAIAMLIRLSTDEDDDVRNWATFGLGTQQEENSEAIRDALAARLDDAHVEVREEALAGLARRQDERVIEPLLAALSGTQVAELAIEAAKDYGSREFLPALQKLRTWWEGDDELLVAAIVLCSR